MPKPPCTRLIIIRFGNSPERMPCNVCAPSAHRPLRCMPLRPCGSKPRRWSRSVVTSKPDAKIKRSTGCSTPLTTTPVSVMRSTPWPSVSTSCTFGRLNAGRYSSWKQTRLQFLPYQALSLSAVAGSSMTSSTRRRRVSIVSKSERSSASSSAGSSVVPWVLTHMTSVHPSFTRSCSGWTPVTAWVKLTIRSACQPGGWDVNHSTSVGALLRTPTADGVRWNTNSSFAVFASCGTACTAVAPVPMMPTRLSRRLTIGSRGLPPV
ncbi:unannotated protein [freshwater metagenome]|uniref:Unannotated protein n=1 Tax=freshwater metagenome TaxID=449393 RepID=A0A6J7RFM9_9ZZZZ